MIRAITPADLPAIRAMGFDHPFGEDYLCGLVRVDEAGLPLMVMAAWQKAEVHMATAEWSTPGARWLALQEMHEAMERELYRRDFREAVTWFDRCEAFCRRMVALRWVQSSKMSYHRNIRGNNG